MREEKPCEQSVECCIDNGGSWVIKEYRRPDGTIARAYSCEFPSEQRPSSYSYNGQYTERQYAQAS